MAESCSSLSTADAKSLPKKPQNPRVYQWIESIKLSKPRSPKGIFDEPHTKQLIKRAVFAGD
jgi:hypothetical protein